MFSIVQASLGGRLRASLRYSQFLKSLHLSFLVELTKRRSTISKVSFHGAVRKENVDKVSQHKMLFFGVLPICKVLVHRVNQGSPISLGNTETSVITVGEAVTSSAMNLNPKY